MDDQPPVPAIKTFRELALVASVQIYTDIHVNLSGLVFFLALSLGVLHPELEDQCKQIAYLAGTYLFASAKTK